MPSGSINVQMRGLHGRGDHPIEIAPALNQFSGSKIREWLKLGQMSTSDRTYYDESLSVSVPGRPSSALATFPASVFTQDVFSIALTLIIPAESRGGGAMVEVRQNVTQTARVQSVNELGSFKSQMQIYRPGDPQWPELKAAFLSRRPIELLMSGFESFGTWTESRSYVAPVQCQLEAWGET